MKKIIIIPIALSLIIAVGFLFYGSMFDDPIPTYVGNSACVCHANITQTWLQTGHALIQMRPSPGTVTARTWDTTISMGSSYGNATVTLSIVGGVYKATLNPTSGSPITYDVVKTLGYQWRQYYLMQIGTSYYRLPFEWEYEAYNEPQTGSFSPQSQSTYFNTDGTLKSTATNTFRGTTVSKGCLRCHTSGGQVRRVVSGTDTSWTIDIPFNDTTSFKVGCEACHGPGSDHVTSPNVNNIFGPTRMNQAGLERKQEVCGQCHNRISSTNLTYGFPWKESVDSGYMVGTPLINYMVSDWRNRVNGVGGPSTWPDTMTKRAYRQQWPEMQLSNHAHNQFLKCWDCHSQHALTGFEHQLKRDPDNNDMCMQCHQNFGTPGNPNILATTQHTGHVFDPENTSQTGGASRCTKCHVPKTASMWNTSIYDLHSHTFWAIPPIQTLRKFRITSPTLGMLNSCSISCHRNPSTAAGTGNVPNLGVGYDSTLFNWNQRTDSLLADTLNRWFSRHIWVIGIKKISNEVPDKYSLSQNYPNPFNPTTTISFSIPKSGFVTLTVYDITGQEVAVLVNEQLGIGTYSYNWNSVNKSGADVASGVYFYRIVVGGFVESKKMMVIR